MKIVFQTPQVLAKIATEQFVAVAPRAGSAFFKPLSAPALCEDRIDLTITSAHTSIRSRSNDRSDAHAHDADDDGRHADDEQHDGRHDARHGRHPAHDERHDADDEPDDAHPDADDAGHDVDAGHDLQNDLQDDRR